MIAPSTQSLVLSGIEGKAVPPPLVRFPLEEKGVSEPDQAQMNRVERKERTRRQLE